jgi:predicted component of type VI protein secretion system
MDGNTVQSLSRTYAPKEYVVWLSTEDRRHFEGYEDELRDELTGYLLEHARRERLALLTRPQIEFRTDDRLRLGEFGIQARLVRSGEDRDEQPSQGAHGHTMVYSTSERLSEPLQRPDPRRGSARVHVDGRTSVIGSRGAVLGRSRESDVVLDDANVSRRHAEIRPSGASWIIVDLGSTNGVRVNGRRIDGPQSLRPGDTIELGGSRIAFEVD